MWGLGQIAAGPMAVIGISIMLLLIAAVVVIQRDIMPVVPLALFTMCLMPNPNLPSYIWVVAIPAVCIVFAALFHMYYYKIDDFKFGKLFFPMVLFLIAILLGGIGSKLPSRPKGMLLGALLIVIAPLFVYMMAINYVDVDKKPATYIAKTMLYWGFLMCIELGIFYVFDIEILRALGGYNVPHLGWGISNTIATFFLITFPMCFYLFTQIKGKLSYMYLLIGNIEFGAIIATTSRGALLFGAVEFIFTIIVTAFVVDRKKRIGYLIFAAVILVICAIVLAISHERIFTFFRYIFQDNLNDSGRFELYREALACFFEYPIFGVGLGYLGKATNLIDTIGIYMFHDTILQYGACLGVVGILAIAYLYFARLEIVFENWSNYSLYILMAFIGFEGYSLLNTGTMQGYPTAIVLIMVYGAYEIETKQQESIVYKKILEKIKINKKAIKNIA